VTVTDLTMPHVDGFALLEELKKSPVWRGIPVIACAGVTGRDRELVTAGFADMLIKPIVAEDLTVVIARVVAGRTG